MIRSAYFLSRAALQAPSPDNSQPWKLDWQENTLTVRYDGQRVADKTFPPDSHATLITMGALLENLTQAAAALTIQMDQTFPTSLDAHDPEYFQAAFKPDGHTANPTPEIDAIPLFMRHTNRHPYHNRSIPGDLVTELKNLRQDSARILVFEDKTKIHEIANLVQTASEVRFQTQQVHEWLAKSLRFDTKSNDQYGEGLDVATIDLPPGGKLFLRFVSDWQRMNWFNKVGGYKAMAMIDSQPVAKAPLLFAVVGPGKFRETMAAGQLMNRAWIALNKQGLAVHPYYVVADQLQRKLTHCIPVNLAKQADAIAEQSQRLFQLNENDNLHMLFRVGYPIKTPVKSKRLPLNSLCFGLE